MHYDNYISTQDKIVHLLVAALCEDLYFQAIKECMDKYGIIITNKAIISFYTQYASLIQRLGGDNNLTNNK